MKHINKIVFLFLLLASVNSYSQMNKFKVEFHKISGKLTKSDLIRKDFGRYDGFEIPAYKGEAVNFMVFSDEFTPMLILANPEGKKYKQAGRRGEQFATLVTVIPENGTWYLYVVADSTAEGDYYFQYGFAEPNSITLEPNANFCTTMDFVLTHANAYFVFFENPVDYHNPIAKFQNAVDTYLDGNDGSYNARMYDGNDLKTAEKMFKEYSNKIKDCLPGNWKNEFVDWRKAEDYREKYFMFTENSKKDAKFAKLVFYDFSNLEEEFQNDYSIDIVINKNNR